MEITVCWLRRDLRLDDNMAIRSRYLKNCSGSFRLKVFLQGWIMNWHRITADGNGRPVRAAMRYLISGCSVRKGNRKDLTLKKYISGDGYRITNQLKPTGNQSSTMILHASAPLNSSGKRSNC